jgi:hypothetical protein
MKSFIHQLTPSFFILRIEDRDVDLGSSRNIGYPVGNCGVEITNVNPEKQLEGENKSRQERSQRIAAHVFLSGKDDIVGR